ncbi:MAG: T9SS type A sorting domain-containing protein [Burkholderiales bacterium]|nr:T9SS type A sorting domain-containing protein [Bacteroidia bacterium]
MRKKAQGFILFIAIVFNMQSQNTKGFYVDGFNNILGNTIREDSILLFAKNNGFNYLTLYNVYQVNSATPLTNTTTAQTFANFINKAKTQYSITEVGVAAENYTFFRNVIHLYNQQHPSANQKVDVYNLEFEFWIPPSVTSGSYYCTTYLQPNGFSCDTAGAFGFYKKTLKRIDSLANATGQKSEAYFGFFNAGQGKQIAQTGVDRVLLSIYIPSANYSQSYQYNYVKPRLQALATASTNIKVMPLYSSEPSFMQTWANANPFFLPYTNLVNSLTAESGLWKTYIQPEGIQWFAYSFLPKKNLTTGIRESTKGSDSFSLYPNPGKDIITIEAYDFSATTTVSIKNILGEEFLLFALDQSNREFDVSSFAKGIYFITLHSVDKTITKKIVVER